MCKTKLCCKVYSGVEEIHTVKCTGCKLLSKATHCCVGNYTICDYDIDHNFHIIEDINIKLIEIIYIHVIINII